MNEPASDATLGRIRKLLAQAEHPNTSPTEAEAFTAKAAALIARYGIDRALLAATDPTTDLLADRTIHVDAPYARDKATLAAWVGMALGCRCTISGPHPRGQIRVAVFGFASDIDRAELLYTSLLIQASNALAVVRPPWGEHPAAFRRTFYGGFAAAVSRRLKAAEARAQKEHTTHSHAGGGSSVALVLADRHDQVDRYYTQRNPNIGKARPRRLSGSGRTDGYTAGMRADLDDTRLPSGGHRREVSR
jgi:hypothetical protein